MDPELCELLMAWLNDDDPGAARQEALLARLRDDASFRHDFLEEIRLVGMLTVVQSSAPRWLRLEDVCGWSRPEPVSAAVLAQQVVQAAMRRQHRRSIVRGSLAVAAALMLAVGALVFFRSGSPPRRALGSHLELATAVQLEGLQWAEGTELRPAEGNTVTAGQLRLRAGRLTLAFFNGVLLTLEGPVDLELQALDRAVCRAGKLRVRVPSGAEGFTILAPGYEIMGLNTETGLNVLADATSHARVFDGAAVVSILNSEGRSVRSAVLSRGREVSIDGAGARIEEVAPQPDRYVSLPQVFPPDLPLSDSYPATVLAAQPWGYWRFEHVLGERVPNEVAGRPGLELQEGVRLDGAGGRNHWAFFQAGNPRQSLLMDGEWSPPRGSGYAIEVWIQADTLGQSALVSLIAGTEGPENHVSLLELTARSSRTPFEPCAVRFLDRWPPSTMGGANVFSRRTFIPPLWHHIVGQKTRDTVELYLDGHLVGSCPTLPDSADPAEVTRPCRLLVGRLKQWPVPTWPNQVRAFEGRIDELALYERPLLIEEIRRHAQR